MISLVQSLLGLQMKKVSITSPYLAVVMNVNTRYIYILMVGSGPMIFSPQVNSFMEKVKTIT